MTQVAATGDLGEWRPDGALRVAGRKADTIVSGGENVAPAEVEAVLEAHPDVVEAAVHGRADPEWGEAVVATVVAARRRRAPRTCARGARRAWRASRCPRTIAFTVALPRTPSGKVAAKGAAMRRPSDRRARASPAGTAWPPAGRRRAPTSSARWSPSRSGWWRRSTRSRATACSSWRPASATPGCWPRELVAPGGSVLITDGSDNDGRRRRASTPRRSARRTSNYGACRPSGSTSRRRRSTACICRFGYMLLARPRGGAARDAARAQARRARRAGGVGRPRAQPVDEGPARRAAGERGLAPDGRARRPGAVRAAAPGGRRRAARDRRLRGRRGRAAGPRRRRREPRCLVGSHHADVDRPPPRRVRGLAPAEHYAIA